MLGPAPELHTAVARDRKLQHTPPSIEQSRVKEFGIPAPGWAPSRHYVLKGQFRSDNPLDLLETGPPTVSGISEAIKRTEEAYLEIKIGHVVQRKKIPGNTPPEEMEDFLMYVNYVASV